MPQLTGQEIVNIIQAGHDAKVASLKLFGIEISYQLTTPASVTPEPIIIQRPQADAPITPEQREEQRSFYESQLAITDPAAYEAMKLENNQ